MAQVNISPSGPTLVDPHPTAKHVSLQPAPSPVTSTAEDHTTSDSDNNGTGTRFFIGPVPVSVAAPQIKRLRRAVERLTRTRSVGAAGSESESEALTEDDRDGRDERPPGRSYD